MIADRFTILRPLGGNLLLVQDHDGMPRVLKRLPEPLATDPAAILSFRLEAYRVARLSGPHLVAADPGLAVPGDRPFYLMGYAEGPPATLVPTGELPALVRQLAQALATLHGLGYVHAALEPACVRRGEAGITLVGYGNLTPIGQVATKSGNAEFQSPEQAAGAPLDGRADLYSLGALIHYWMTGEPVGEKNRLEGLDGPLPVVGRRLLSVRPQDRFADAAAVLAALDVEMATPPPRLVPPVLARPRALGPIEARLAELSAGTGGAFRLEGPPGAGKTTLLAQAEEAARRAGWPVLRARGGGPTAEPLAPWRALASALWALAPERDEQAAARLAGRLAPPGPDEPHALLRYRLAWLEALTALAPPGLVVLLDDWEAADPASRAHLTYLRRRLVAAPVLWGVAGTTVELADWPALPLPAFGREESLQVVTAMLDAPASTPDMEAIHAITMGQPWFLRHMVVHLLETATLRREGPQWVVDTLEDWPTGPEALAWQRAATLEPEAWAVGAAVAMAGPLALPDALGRLVADPDALIAGLDALLRAQVLVRGTEGYRFCHPAYAPIFADGLAPHDQADAHAALAKAAPMGTAEADALMARAWHAVGASRPDLLGTLALEAARLALAQGSPETARTYLEEGMATLDAESPRRGAYMAAMGEACRDAGDLEGARMLYEAALETQESGPDKRGATLALAGVLEALGETALARDRAREVVAAATMANEPELLTRALTRLTGLQAVLGETEAAIQAGEAAVGAASDAAGLTRAAAMAALGRVLASAGRERQAEGVALLQRASALYEAEADRPGLARVLVHLAEAELGVGELKLAGENAERGLAMALELEDPTSAVRAGLLLATVARELGDAEGAIARAVAARAAAEAAGEALLTAAAQAEEGLSRMAAGDIELGVTMTGSALARLSASAPPAMVAALGLAHAEALLAASQLPEAVSALLSAREAVERAGRPELAARRALLLGRWAARTGDRERARQEFKAVLGSPNHFLVAQAALALGRLAMAAGAQAEAAGWLEQARRGATSLVADALVAEVAAEERALADQGSAEPATPAAAAQRLEGLMREMSALLPRLTDPARELETLKQRVRALEGLNALWKRLYAVENAPAAARAVADAVIEVAGAERAFVLDGALAPLASRGRQGGDLPFSPALIRQALCEAAMAEGELVWDGEGVVAVPLGPYGVINVVGAESAAAGSLEAIAEAGVAALGRVLEA